MSFPRFESLCTFLLCCHAATWLVAGERTSGVVWQGSEWEAAQQALDTGDYPAALAEHVLHEFRVVDGDAPERYQFDRLRLQELVFSPTSPLAKLRQARAYRYFKRSDEAHQIYGQLQTEFPQSALLRCDLAMFALEEGRWDEAAQLIAAAEKLQPGSAYVPAARGAMLQAEGKPEAAKSAYETALGRNPYLGGVHGRLALLMHALIDEGKIQLGPETSPLSVARSAGGEMGAFAFGFPWRLPAKRVTAPDASPLDAALSQFHRGDIQGARIALETLRSRPDQAAVRGRLTEAIGLNEAAIGDYYRALWAESPHRNAAPLYRAPNGQSDHVSGLESLSRDGAMGQLSEFALIRSPALSQEDYLLTAAMQCKNAMTAKSDLNDSAEAKMMRGAAKIQDTLNLARRAPSLAASDPLTATAQLLSDAMSIAPASPSGTAATADQTRQQLRLLYDMLQLSTAVHQQDCYSVREMARTYLNTETRDYYRLFYDCGMQFRQATNDRNSQLRANELFLRSATLPEAAYELGRSYENGIATDLNLNTAAAYFDDAVRGGFKQAEPRLKVVQSKLDEEKRKRRQQMIDELGADAVKELEEQASMAESRGSRANPLGSGPIGPSHLRFAKITSYGDALTNEAVRGNAEAQWLLGLCHLWGKLETWRFPGDQSQHLYAVDPKISFHWFTKAAEQGHPSAEFLVGRAYYFGFGVAADPQLARVWLEKAERHGDVLAPYLLKQASLDALPEEKLWITAAEIMQIDPNAENLPLETLTRKADQGNVRAQSYMADIYISVGNYRDAVPWLKLAADAGDVDSQYSLGERYFDDDTDDGVPRDLDLAWHWFSQAAAKGNKMALGRLKSRELAFPLAVPQPNTEGSRQESQLAYALAMEAEDIEQASVGVGRLATHAKAGDPTGCRLYGQLMNGTCRFARPDREKMLYWYQHAAELGDLEAQFLMGREQFATDVKLQNLPESVRWLEMAAKGNHPQAITMLPIVKAALAEASRPKPAIDPNKLLALKAEAQKGLEELTTAISVEPDNASNYGKRSAAYLMLGQNDAALRDADELIRLQPNVETGYGIRYLALTLLGRAEEAAAAKVKFQEIHPGRAEKLDEELQVVRQAQMK